MQNLDVQVAAEERAAAAEARELETVRLRAQQQRAADTQAQIDELRARRCVRIDVRAEASTSTMCGSCTLLSPRIKSTRGEAAASATTTDFGVMMTGGQCTCRRAGGRLQRRRRRGLRRTPSARARLQCKGEQMGTPSCHMP